MRAEHSPWLHVYIIIITSLYSTILLLSPNHDIYWQSSSLTSLGVHPSPIIIIFHYNYNIIIFHLHWDQKISIFSIYPSIETNLQFLLATLLYPFLSLVVCYIVVPSSIHFLSVNLIDSKLCNRVLFEYYIRKPLYSYSITLPNT